MSESAAPPPAPGDHGGAGDVPAERWHGRSVDEWRVRWGVPALLIFRRVGSTNDIARELARRDASHGTLVLADEQTRGRGRRGRSWHALPGRSLLLSVVLRPSTATSTLLPLRVGLAVARAVETHAGVRIGIKWPNDLVVDGRKLGGVLCEAVAEGAAGFVVAGIGLNVLQRAEDWPPALRRDATSLAAEGAEVALPALAEAVGRAVSIATAGAPPRLLPEELDELHRRDVLRGKEVLADGSPAGRVVGLDPAGALLVQNEAGTRALLTGTIRPAPGAGAAETEP